MGGADDAGRGEQLVRLAEDAEDPVLAAGVGMITLGLCAVGVADLLERGVGRDAEDLERVDLEAELRHVIVSRRPRNEAGELPDRIVARPLSCRGGATGQCGATCNRMTRNANRFVLSLRSIPIFSSAFSLLMKLF